MALVIIMIIQTVESIFLLPVEAPEDEIILNGNSWMIHGGVLAVGNK